MGKEVFLYEGGGRERMGIRHVGGGKRPPCRAFWHYAEDFDSITTKNMHLNKQPHCSATSLTQGKGTKVLLRNHWQ